MVAEKSTINNYLELIKAIKNTKVDNNYNPNNYDFNLDSFNNKKKQKKESIKTL